jgi:crotonobetainyl-CoA:carnitine CoA-transferase CaiB-like acyl-CoA transferase
LEQGLKYRESGSKQPSLRRYFEGSETRTVNSPVVVCGADKVQPRMPPAVGQHSDEVLKEAGFDDAAIPEMRAAGAIG